MVPIDQAIAVGDRVVLEVADDDIRLYGAA
jgi:hypothetical protein